MSTTNDLSGEGIPSQRRFLLFYVAAAGSLLLFLSQPPIRLSPLAWIAPLPWLALATSGDFSVRRPYLQIWFASFIYWVCTLHWIRLAHPWTWLGLVGLAGYLAVYLPVFVALVRTGSRRLPLWMVAPVVWTGLELAQGRLLGGFLMGTLGQTQIDWLSLVQISDLGGAYLVSMLVMLGASCLFEILQAVAVPSTRPRWVRAIAAGGVLVVAITGTLWYGQQRLALTDADQAPTRRVALVQGSHRAVWTHDPGRDQRVMASYIELSLGAVEQARREGKPIDLLVWPEGMFRTALFSFDDGFTWKEPNDITTSQVASYGPNDLKALVGKLGVPILVGIDRQHAHSSDTYDFYNSVVAVDRTGKILGTYDKTHLVMIGEYVPGGTWWPGIYDFFPIGRVTPGKAPRSLLLEGVRYMPTICFETVLPHVVRGQVAKLSAVGERPDVLVNVTNGSWFNDSSELEMHLTCSRFRAIECRTPLVVAANGGLSAHIDRSGRLLAVSQPVAEEWLLVDVQPGGGESFYVRHGDWVAGGSLIATALLAIIGLVGNRCASRTT